MLYEYHVYFWINLMQLLNINNFNNNEKKIEKNYVIKIYKNIKNAKTTWFLCSNLCETFCLQCQVNFTDTHNI